MNALLYQMSVIDSRTSDVWEEDEMRMGYDERVGSAYITAKIIYVWYPIDVNETGVIITTIKLNAQFALVLSPLAGALIFNGTISAGYSQVMPSQPTAKNVLKTKSMTAEMIPGAEPPWLTCDM